MVVFDFGQCILLRNKKTSGVVFVQHARKCVTSYNNNYQISSNIFGFHKFIQFSYGRALGPVIDISYSSCLLSGTRDEVGCARVDSYTDVQYTPMSSDAIVKAILRWRYSEAILRRL